jgi:signal transduction histidine kinase
VLHNIARHAQATRARFHLTPNAEGLRIEITDNGAGFDIAQAASGHGLSNLRERATVMQASLRIVSTPGTGTSITLDLPRGPRWRKPVA